MNKSTKKWLVLLMAVLIVTTVCLLVACDLFGDNNKKEFLEIQASGDIPSSVTQEKLPDYLRVLYFDKSGNSRFLDSSEYTITYMEKKDYNRTINVTVKYLELMQSAVLPMIDDPTYKINFTSVFCENIPSEIFEEYFVEGVELTASDLPVPKRTGWTFLNWCYDQELQHSFDGSQQEVFELFGKWEYNFAEGETRGFEFAVLTEGAIVTGFGSVTDKDIVVPAKFDNKPVIAVNTEVFRNNTDITSVVLPSTVNILAMEAFSNCTELRSINLSDLDTIADKTFYNCSNLSDINMPSNLRVICREAFFGCSALTDVKIPASVRGIDESAFVNCSELVNFEFRPDCETMQDVYNINVGAQILVGCNKLKTLALPFNTLNGEDWTHESVTELEITCGQASDSYMGNFPNLQTLTIGEKVTEITSFMPLSISKLNFNAIDCRKNTRDTVFQGFNGPIDVVFGSKVTYIPSSLFSGCQQISVIDLPESVDIIGIEAFKDSSLREITIRGSSVYIARSAFSNSSVERMTVLSNEVETDGTISGCDNLTTVTAPMSFVEKLFVRSVQSLTITNGEILTGGSAISGNSNLSRLVLPDTLISLSNVDLSGCTSLQYNEFSGVKYLGSSTNPTLALISAPNRETFEVPANVHVIYSKAFDSCDSLTSVTVNSANSHFKVDHDILYGTANKSICFVSPDITGNVVVIDGVEEIPINAFENTKITSITLPSSVVSIGTSAFSGCTLLESAHLKDTKIDWIQSATFDGCTELTTVELPSTVTEINSFAFRNCTKLNSISLPNKIQEIKQGAFLGCTSLQSITFSANLTNFGRDAFKNCSALSDIRYEGNVGQWREIKYDSIGAPFVGVGTDKVICADGEVTIYT